MKYCKKCGMLLEDTYSTCIRCGWDVSKTENVSLYPPEVEDTMDAKKEQDKNKIKIIILIVCILIALAGIIGVVAIGVSSGNLSIPGYVQSADNEREADADEEDADAEDEEILDETDAEDEEAEDETSEDDGVVLGEESTTELGDTLNLGANDAAEDTDVNRSSVTSGNSASENRVVKDAKGRYYNYTEETDEVGNVIFEAVYPEGFSIVDFSVDYEKYSNVYPIGMTFTASGEEGGVNFIYMSPQQLWDKNSETGSSLRNNRVPNYYMTYYKYDGAKGYIEAMLAESYKGAKIELVNEEEISPKKTASMKELSGDKGKELFGDIGDYAHIGDDTTYAKMDAEYSACVYEYEITKSNKEMVFDKFYVPVISNDLYYASEEYNDRGTVTEWYFLAFAVMEAGNEDLYDDYSKDFDVFVANSVPTEKFFAINQQYGSDIDEFVDAQRAVEPLTEDMLKEYGSKKVSLSTFNSNVLKALNAGATMFDGDGLTLHSTEDTKVAFVDKENGRVFLSPEGDEYPGDKYTELTAGDADEDDVMSEDAEEEDEDIEASDDEEDEDDTKDKKVKNNSGLM